MEPVLTCQAVKLDNSFANIADRVQRQRCLKYMETCLRLSLKAQAQCRLAIEALALLGDPRPCIRQANIAQRDQQGKDER